MTIKGKTRRRWILSVLAAVTDTADNRRRARAVQRPRGHGLAPGQKGLALRLKAVTRPLAEAARQAF